MTMAASFHPAGPDEVQEPEALSGIRLLTPREQEVAALVARGLTNIEIAQALCVTAGTAANHVESIRRKLACRSRTQVAAVWTAGHGASGAAEEPPVAPRLPADTAHPHGSVQHPVGQEPAHPESHASHGERRVLVVEDDPTVRTLLTDLLRGEGCTVGEAGDGEEALRLAEQFQPHVVLLDLGLPGLSGVEVLRRWSDDHSLHPWRVVVATAQLDALASLATDHVDALLPKPFSIEALLAAIEQACATGSVARVA